MSVHPTAGPHLVAIGRDHAVAALGSRGDSQPLPPPLRPSSAAGSTQRTVWRLRPLCSPGQPDAEAPYTDAVPKGARVRSAVPAGSGNSTPLHPAGLPVDLDHPDHLSTHSIGHVSIAEDRTTHGERICMPRITIVAPDIPRSAPCGAWMMPNACMHEPPTRVGLLPPGHRQV